MRFVDTAIVGGGTIGLATAAALSQNSRYSLVVIDADRPPHDHASHHGHTRLVRVAYGEGRDYVPLARAALAEWRRIDRDADAAIFAETGVLNIGQRDDAFVNEVEASAMAFDLVTQ